MDKFKAYLLFFIFSHFWLGLPYWWYMAYDYGSWTMGLLTLLPPFTVVAVVTAIWSFYIGVPDWVIASFGS